MPIINFYKRFEKAILDGSKRQTIRKHRKIPIKKGGILHLYTGLRTKDAKKLKTVECLNVMDIRIEATGVIDINNGSVRVCHQEYLDYFAKRDGFKNHREMMQFFVKVHGLPFEGVLIEW